MFRTLYRLFESLLVIKSKCGRLEQDEQDKQDEKQKACLSLILSISVHPLNFSSFKFTLLLNSVQL